MLEQINSPQDVKKLTQKQKKQLAEEIRKYILDVVSENGGHLASNLGVVELTIALHSVFNVPEDKIVWDVGHQSYVHKIITGRREELKNIRKLNGIAGFPKSNESDADCFNTGHSSTSISAALGMARARDLQGKKNSCIAVIGDGALTGIIPSFAIPADIVIACCSAIPTSKNLFGNSFWNSLSPVPSFIDAVTATIFSFSLASFTNFSPNILE